LLQPGDDPVRLTERYRRGQTLEAYRRIAVVGGPQEIIDTYGRLLETGVEYIIVSDLPGLVHLDVLEYLASEVLAAFSDQKATQSARSTAN
jgi:hypothetical protein